MRMVLTAVCLLVCLSACSDDDDAMAHMAGDVYYVPGHVPVRTP